jgi:hypothetical protein
MCVKFRVRVVLSVQSILSYGYRTGRERVPPPFTTAFGFAGAAFTAFAGRVATPRAACASARTARLRRRMSSATQSVCSLSSSPRARRRASSAAP